MAIGLLRFEDETYKWQVKGYEDATSKLARRKVHYGEVRRGKKNQGKFCRARSSTVRFANWGRHELHWRLTESCKAEMISRFRKLENKKSTAWCALLRCAVLERA
jgi:hypothetical protein